jgi:hypothetical protein
MKTIVIILGLLVGQVLAQTTQSVNLTQITASVNLDRLVNVVHYPSRDWYYARGGKKKFDFDSVSIPKYYASQTPVINTSKRKYIQRKFDFNKRKIYLIFNEGFHFGVDSISCVNKLNDHTIQVVVFEQSKDKQLLDEYALNPGEIYIYEDYIIDFEKNLVTYRGYSIMDNLIWSKLMYEPTFDNKLIVNRFDNK